MTALLVDIVIMIFITPSIGFATISSHSNKLTSKYFDSGICLQEATCIPLHNSSCFGTSLPYTSTSIALAGDSSSQFDVQDNLALWQGLRSVPRCWAHIQPFLCAVYMPKCENGSVFLPSQEMCRTTRGHCKVVEKIHGWPPFLQCENKKLFPPRCRNPLQEVKFNTSSKCMPPLVETNNEDNYYHDIVGCGLQCQNPFFSKEEHDSIHHVISIFASIGIAVSTLTVVTFMISWKAANRYPAVIIFYINLCIALVWCGFLLQFLPGTREQIVCNDDGTIRKKQPKSGKLLCSITFILIYYFLMASLVWNVILAYAWYVLFKQTGTPTDIVQKKVAYFHLAAWSIPLILMTAVMAMTGVDGDSMSGICFVGYANMKMRIFFLLVPIGVAVLVGSFFMARVLYTLIKVKLKSEEVANVMVKKKIQSLIGKIGAFSLFALIFVIATIACHAYDFSYLKEWDINLRDNIVCLAMNSENRYGETSKCQLKNKPPIEAIYIKLSALFAYGIIMSLWVWTRESLESWKRFFYRHCAPAERNKYALKRHKIISEAFRKRHEINQGRYSLSLNSTHEDPFGLNIEVNSVASRDISTSWAAALPHFLDRRNAVAGIMPFMPRQYSSASDMSRHVSVDSYNQPNLDSLSMQISEQEYVQAFRHQRRKTRKERERFLRANRIAPWFPGNRRGSDTSLQSSFVVASFAAAAAAQQAGISARVTKSTSTGDLGAIPTAPPPPGSAMCRPLIMPPVNTRPQIQRQAINPPFTHGMTDNSHRLGSRVPSVASALPRVNSGQRYAPSQCSVVPNSLVGMVRPPVYGGSYDVLNSVPYVYFSNGMYPPVNNFFPGYAYNPEYMYNPYVQYNSYASCSAQQDILPMNPIADSASETDFFPIKLSDSEYTDTGMRSYDEYQLMTTQRLMQEHLEAQAAAQDAAAAAEEAAAAQAAVAAQAAAAAASVVTPSTSQPKTQQDSEVSVKTKSQFLKIMWPFKSNPVQADVLTPPPGRKSAHSEVPPPSPVDDESKSINEDELDDVFVDDPVENEKHVSVVSLPPASRTTSMDNVFYKVKTKFVRAKFRRATSCINNLEKINTIELTSKVHHSSLLQLSRTDSSFKNSKHQKEILKEKWLHASEGISLMNGDTTAEHVSR